MSVLTKGMALNDGPSNSTKPNRKSSHTRVKSYESRATSGKSTKHNQKSSHTGVMSYESGVSSGKSTKHNLRGHTHC